MTEIWLKGEEEIRNMSKDKDEVEMLENGLQVDKDELINIDQTGMETLDDIRANIMKMSVFDNDQNVADDNHNDHHPNEDDIESMSKLPVFTFNTFDPLGEILAAASRRKTTPSPTSSFEKENQEKIKANERENVMAGNEEDTTQSTKTSQWYYEHMPNNLKSKFEEQNIAQDKNYQVLPNMSEESESVTPVAMKLTDEYPSGFPQLFGGKNDLEALQQQQEQQRNELEMQNSLDMHRDKNNVEGMCASPCMCVCPSARRHQAVLPDKYLWSNPEKKSQTTHKETLKRLGLDVSLYPCARSAAYQLSLAMKMCRRLARKNRSLF